jgi:hypothetical protein
LKTRKQIIAVTEEGIKLIEKKSAMLNFVFRAIEADCDISLVVSGGYAGQYFFKRSPS